MKHILITGGCGFIGSNLAVALIQDGCAVTCFDNLSRKGSELLLDRIQENGCTFVRGDIRNTEDFNKLKEKYDCLIECSAEPSVLVGSKGSDAMFMINNNLIGAINCFEFSRQRGLSTIFLSTSRVYPYDMLGKLKFKETDTRFEYNDSHPAASNKGITTRFALEGYRSLYGATKLAAEFVLREYSHNYEIPSIINRCGVIAGPWQLGKQDQGVFTYWLASHYFKNELTYIGFGGKGKQVRDLLHIDDLTKLIKTQLSSIEKFRGNIFNVGGSSKSNLSLLESTHLCREITGNTVNISSRVENRPSDVIWYITDNGDTEKEFDWKVTHSGNDVLADIFSWLSANEKIFKHLWVH